MVMTPIWHPSTDELRKQTLSRITPKYDVDPMVAVEAAKAKWNEELRIKALKKQGKHDKQSTVRNSQNAKIIPNQTQLFLEGSLNL